jgi:hypothetical protein
METFIGERSKRSGFASKFFGGGDGVGTMRRFEEVVGGIKEAANKREPVPRTWKMTRIIYGGKGIDLRTQPLDVELYR